MRALYAYILEETQFCLRAFSTACYTTQWTAVTSGLLPKDCYYFGISLLVITSHDNQPEKYHKLFSEEKILWVAMKINLGCMIEWYYCSSLLQSNPWKSWWIHDNWVLQSYFIDPERCFFLFLFPRRAFRIDIWWNFCLETLVFSIIHLWFPFNGEFGSELNLLRSNNSCQTSTLNLSV